MHILWTVIVEADDAESAANSAERLAEDYLIPDCADYVTALEEGEHAPVNAADAKFYERLADAEAAQDAELTSARTQLSELLARDGRDVLGYVMGSEIDHNNSDLDMPGFYLRRIASLLGHHYCVESALLMDSELSGEPCLPQAARETIAADPERWWAVQLDAHY